MNEHSLKHLINIIATFTLLIPIAAGLMKYKIAEGYLRIFFFLLIYGFITDVLIWQLKNVSKSTAFVIYNAYDLVESTVLFSLIRKTSDNITVKRICLILILIAIPSWSIIFFSYHDEQPHMVPFDTSYNIAVAFLTGFVMLKLSEKEISLKEKPLFWILLGLFIYSFSTFFVSSLFEDRKSVV